MAKKIYFKYGNMDSGKSAMLCFQAFNYQSKGMDVVIGKPSVDTKSAEVSSRIGLSYPVDINILPEDSLFEKFTQLIKTYPQEGKNIKCFMIDEAQFLTRENVNDLLRITLETDIAVMAYGLRTDFTGTFFAGSQRLFEIAHSLEEIKTMCACGIKTMFNARKINEEFVQEGNQIGIDGEVQYESMCAGCYVKKVGKIV